MQSGKGSAVLQTVTQVCFSLKVNLSYIFFKIHVNKHIKTPQAAIFLVTNKSTYGLGKFKQDELLCCTNLYWLCIFSRELPVSSLNLLELTHLLPKPTSW